MTEWRDWREMAEDALRAARLLEKESPRSSVSRYYYAAYQLVTAVLHYHGGLTPPDNREAWKHKYTPDMVSNHFGKFASRRTINEIASELTQLYQLRIYSDYVSAVLLLNALARARKQATFIIRICEDILEKAE